MPGRPLMILESPAIAHITGVMKGCQLWVEPGAGNGSAASPGCGAISHVTIQPGRTYLWWWEKMTQQESLWTVHCSCCLSTSSSFFSRERETKQGATILAGAIDLDIRICHNREGGITVAPKRSTWMPLATPLLNCDGKWTSAAILAWEGHGDQEPRPLSDGVLPPGGPLRHAQVIFEGEGNPEWIMEEGDVEYQCGSKTSCRVGSVFHSTNLHF